MSQFFSQPWVGPALGAAGILIGVAAAYYFYRRSVASGVLACQWDGLTVVDAEDPESPNQLTVHFRATEVRRLSVTEIILWNAGDKTIRREDLVAADPLTISFGDGVKILEAEILRVTRNAIGPTLEVGDSRKGAVFAFAFLDPGDGVALRVAHTGKRIAPMLSGTIIGMQDGVRLWGRIASGPRSAKELLERRKARHGRVTSFDRVMAAVVSKNRGSAFLLVAAGLGLATAAVGALRPVLVPFFPNMRDIPAGALILAGLLYAAMPLAMMWSNRRRYPRILSPDSHSADAGE